MRRMGGRGAALAVAGTLLLTACAGGDADDLDDVLSAEITETEDPEPEPTATEDEVDEVEDPVDEVDLEAYAVPAEIDDAYVLSVLDAMHEGFLPALRDAVAAGEVTPELEDALADIYVADRVEHALEGWVIRIAAELDGQPLRELDPQPEPRQHLAFYGQLLSDECVLGTLEVDEAGWYEDEGVGVEERGLTLVQAEPAPPVNPTPWRIAYDSRGMPEVETCER
jgi:hypothetical protein